MKERLTIQNPYRLGPWSRSPPRRRVRSKGLATSRRASRSIRPSASSALASDNPRILVEVPAGGRGWFSDGRSGASPVPSPAGRGSRAHTREASTGQWTPGPTGGRIERAAVRASKGRSAPRASRALPGPTPAQVQRGRGQGVTSDSPEGPIGSGAGCASRARRSCEARAGPGAGRSHARSGTAWRGAHCGGAGRFWTGG